MGRESRVGSENMKSIGKVVRISRQGLLLSSSPVATEIGQPVSDARSAPIGRVTDVIGPVARPYIVIAPQKGARVQALLGKELFVR